MSALAPITSTSELALPAHWVARLFERLSLALGNKLSDLYAGKDRDMVEAEWARGLVGFTREELARGMEACQRRRFAPTLGEFCHLCRPALDPEWAWNEAQIGLQARDAGEVGAWSHPAVFRAAKACSWDLRRKTYREARHIWDIALHQEFAKGWVEDVQPPPIRVENRPTLTPMPAAVKQRLSEIANSLRFK